MDNTRLEEIKASVDDAVFDNVSGWYMTHLKELITALEAARAELDKEKADVLYLIENKSDIHAANADLRAQLAEAQKAVEFWKYEMPELRESEM